MNAHVFCVVSGLFTTVILPSRVGLKRSHSHSRNISLMHNTTDVTFILQIFRQYGDRSEFSLRVLIPGNVQVS
jgi:hypothetical protein